VSESPTRTASLTLPAGEGRGEGERPGQTTARPDSTEASFATLFTRAFGTPDITAERLGLALEQFLLTLTSHDAKFDRVLRGEAQFTEQEQRGFELFHTEHDPRRGQFGADCFHCHGGPLFHNVAFANNGLDVEPRDLGRYLVTGREGDKGKFSVPSLRNVELTAPYMHDGRFATLEAAVFHYVRGVQRSPTLDANLAKHPSGGVRLPPEDLRALVAFLKTLTDESLRSSARSTAPPL
jgi:cytochrome c peroxidase